MLYLSAPILSPFTASPQISPQELLAPYLDSLLSLAATPIVPSFTHYRLVSSTSFPSTVSLPPNVLVVPDTVSQGTTAGLVLSIGEEVAAAETLFWEIVKGSVKSGEDLDESIQFFATDPQTSAQDED